MKIEGNSPSNIETGWRQKYFYHLESDSMLDCFIKIFADNGNNWSMKKDDFDKIIAKTKIDACFSFPPVYDQVLEVDGDFIRFNESVVETLLTNSWQWSLRNMLKNLKKTVASVSKEFVKMVIDAWAFATNPEARIISEFKYPNGTAMSVRDARKQGLIKWSKRI